jgi:hypothetical protein
MEGNGLHRAHPLNEVEPAVWRCYLRQGARPDVSGRAATRPLSRHPSFQSMSDHSAGAFHDR